MTTTMTMSLFQEGYRIGRYALDHTQPEPVPDEYLAGFREGQRHRRMQLAIEFTLCAIPVLTIGIACGAAL